MKKYIISLIILLAVGFNSCTDLTEVPYGFYTDENFYQTPEEAEIALLYAYSAFTFNEYHRGYFDLGDLPSEVMDLKPNELQNGRTELVGWTVSPNTEAFRNFFKQSYIGINRANAVIDNLEGITFDPAEKDQIVGEALFLRSWHHFVLVRLFGAIPIRISLVAEESDVQTQLSSIEEVYNQIIADLIDAEAKMTINRRHGRADKVAAQGLLSKIYLTLASSKATGVPRYEWVPSADDMYAKAAEWAGKVVNDQSVYGLYTGNVRDIFYPGNDDTNPEHIFFEGNHHSDPESMADMNDMFLAYNSYASYYFLEQDGSLTQSVTTGWEVYRTNPDYFATFDPVDNRALELYTNSIYNANGDKINNFQGWIMCKKYVDPNPEAENWGKNGTKILFMRYSDIALVYAEAAGATPAAYAQVNAIRTRSGLPNLSPGLSNEAFREAVFQERGWELNFEGHRLFELRRTRKMVEKLGDVDYAYFYPLPQSELDLNPNISEDEEKKSLR
jgi:hypothetical protein